VFGQRLMQAAADALLGWTTGTRQPQRHCDVRQLRDAKIKPMVELMNPANLIDHAQSCGWALARAHKRSGDAALVAAVRAGQIEARVGIWRSARRHAGGGQGNKVHPPSR
jgi:hypothetical protein